jgi:hypothetical protein
MNTTKHTETPQAANPEAAKPTGWLRSGWGFLRKHVQVLALLGLIAAAWAGFVAVKTLESMAIFSTYSLGQESTKFFLENPEHRDFFYADERGSITDAELMKRFDELPPLERARVLMACELLADFWEITYEQRRRLPDSDWNTWWDYFIDGYKESPVLQEYFRRRDGWYLVDDPLRDTTQHAKLYR